MQELLNIVSFSDCQDQMTFEEMRFRGTVKTALTNRFLLPTKQVFLRKPD